MVKLVRIAIAVSFVAALGMPHDAAAWSVETAPVNADGSAKFSDPDEQAARLTGAADQSDPQAGAVSTKPRLPAGNWVTPCSAFNPGVAGQPCRESAANVPSRK